MQNLWWLVSIFASFVFAMYIFANQIFKLKVSLMMIYRGIGAALVLLPFCFFINGIDNNLFYGLCVIQGILIAYLDNRLFNAASRFGAEITSVIQPLSVLLGFVMWFIIVPTQFFNLAANPLKLVLVVGAMLGIVTSVILFRKNRLSRLAFLYLLPAMLTVTVLDLLGKILMNIGSDNILGAIFYYSLITSAVAGAINMVAFLKQGHDFKEVVAPRNLFLAGIPMIMLIMGMYVFKNYSLYLSENPAYVMAIIYSYPVWIFVANNIFSKYLKNKEYARPNKWVMISMVVSILVLILTVQN